jgi:hypothetical protein
MRVGKLYEVKKWFWFLAPSLDTCLRLKSLTNVEFGFTGLDGLAGGDDAARLWSRLLNCDISSISEKSFVVVLEKTTNELKVLTGDGRVGWMVITNPDLFLEQLG